MAWLVDRIKAISAINSVRGLGFGDAKLVYEEITKIMYYQYMQWEPNLHPDDLYKLIGSSKELAIKKSEKLLGK